jgi:glycosyltransferase involved in cell wall biosynthesis
MRILIATETYVPDINGAAYFVQRLASRMARRDHEVHVVCPATPLRRGPTDEPMTVHELPSRSVPRYPQVRVAQQAHARRGVRRAINECQPDVVHIQNHFAVGRAALAEANRRSIPVVGTNHFLPANLIAYLPMPAVLEPVVESILWWHLRLTYRRITLATAPTSYAAELTAGACGRDVDAVSCGVDEFVFRPDISATPFVERYAVPEGPTMLVVGRLDPEKHVDELVRALALVRKHIDARLMVVGRGQQRAALEELAQREAVSEYVTFCGLVPDDLMPAAYAAADVYCHAGRAELQSISTLEAMASGKAIVAANARALPLLVTDEVNGYLYPPGEVGALAEQLSTVLANDGLRIQMGEASRNAVLRHSVQRSVSEFEALYARAISSKTRPATCRRFGILDRPMPSISLAGAGTLVASAALALPVLVAFVRPEPARERTEMIASYVVAAISAILSMGMSANYGLTRVALLRGELDVGATRRVWVMALSAIAAIAVVLAALADRGAL